MPCYYPLQAFRCFGRTTDSGKSLITFKKPSACRFEKLDLPCGSCIGCRLERSRQWAMRCVHEARLYDNNCFITLTFDDDHLYRRDNPFSLDVADFQLFMKRLRKRYGEGIRFFHCGEYGEQYGRPHYHACIFNHDFQDKRLWKSVNGNRLYISDELKELWPFGFSTIGDVTFQSAAYVARYIMKKLHGKHKTEFDNYIINGMECNFIDEISGEVLLTRRQEYVTMSRRPGIGKEWFDKNWRDVYVNGEDSVIMNGVKVRPPKYYDSQYEIVSPSDHEFVKHKRKRNALRHAGNNTLSRLRVRERVQKARLRMLPRDME